MSPSDIVIATLFYQFSIYVCVRLARRGFTLGELAVVCNAATALLMETVNMTRMNVSRHGLYMWLVCQVDRCRSESCVYPTSRPTDFRRHS
jgi:hypothetical protein